MKLFKRLPLFKQAFILVFAISFFIVNLFLIYSSFIDAKEAESLINDQLKTDLELVRSTFSESIIVGDYSRIEQQLKNYSGRKNVKEIKFIDSENFNLNSKNEINFDDVPLWYLIPFQIKEITGNTPILVGGKNYGTLVITLSLNDFIHSSYHDFQTTIVIVSLILIPIIFSLLYIINQVLRPLDHLNFVSQKIGEGQLNVRAIIQGPEEIRNFSMAFNLMAEKIQHLLRSLESREKDLEIKRAALINTSKLAAIGEIANGISHEINNPLQVIITRATKISDMIDSNKLDTTQAKESLERIITTSFRINKIVSGLRGFSRKGEHDPFEEISINELILDTLSYCKEKFKKQDVETFFTPIEDFKFECRPTQISQVLLNLLNNAFDAVVDTPSSWIEIKVSADLKKNQFCIFITDSGMGIPRDIAEKIMQPFFTTKEVGKGSGLGLSLSSQLIQVHSGNLKYNPDCKNTQFIITLPFRQPFAYQTPAIQK